ncbi:MAG TPA: PAS domain S-box protein, partial [Isosphaeraceae bacterium]|nr:PAS domain S-box protein [Isosphaeraceae bacterium]
ILSPLIAAVRSARRRADASAADQRASEERYRLIFNSASEGIWTIDSKGRIDFVNRRMAEMLGETVDNMLGRPLLVFFDESDRAEAEQRMERRNLGIEEWFDRHVDFRFRHRSGSDVWAIVSTTPITDEHGRSRGFMGMVTDVTERRKEEEAIRMSESRLRTIIEQSPISIQVLSPDGVSLQANRAWEELWGAKHEQMYNYNLYKDEQLKTAGLMPYFARAFAGEAVVIPPRLYDPRANGRSGRARWVEAFAYPVKDDAGVVREVVLMLLDLTDRKRAERERESLLARARQAWSEAQAANCAKDQFLAVLSHELRTPLTPVLVAVSTLLEDPETPLSVKPVLELTKRNVELEARLIEDLLDVTRISQGKMQLHREVVDAHVLIQRALEICSDEIGSSGLRLDLHLAAADHVVEADPARLQQVFWNLIKNAVKFTPTGGTLTIRSQNGHTLAEGNHEPGSTGSLIVEVCDTGVGIEPELLPKVFNAFEQGELPMVHRFGGLGLGLAISRSVAEAHGGHLTAASAGRDLGATFTLTLMTTVAPLAPQPRLPSDAGIGGPHSSLRILLTEDNEDTLRVMAKLLRQRGHHVLTANCLEAALKVAEHEEFDLVVSDIGLPDGSGLDLMRQLRAHCAVKGIALSGYGREDDIRKSQEAGFTAHLTKPIDARKLDDMIQRVTQA